ncbi:hypothetical protein F2P79_012903 [Pimephales promelas]|nr:hypothetical protein F2P79_012903 [Pimephales promelas]
MNKRHRRSMINRTACKRRENPEGDAFKDCIGEVDRNKQDHMWWRSRSRAILCTARKKDMDILDDMGPSGI